MTSSTAAVAVSPAPLSFSGFEGRAARRHIGEHAAVLICPEDRSVSVYRAIGSGVPALVWHRRAQLVAVSPDASLEAVEEALRSNGLVEQIVALYDGKEWDGSNHVGRWGGADGELLALLDELQQELRDLPRYVDADEWLAPVSSDLAEYVAERVRKGARPADAIADVASDEAGAASGEGAIVDEEEAREAVARFYARAVYHLIDRTELSTDGLDEDDVESVVTWIGDDEDSVPVGIAALCLDRAAVEAAEESYFA